MLVTLLTIAEIAYVVVLSSWIALQRRSPIATLAWILLVVALPIGGLVAYYLVGYRRVQKSRLKRVRARLGLRQAKQRIRAGCIDPAGAAFDVRTRQLMTLATQVSDAPPSSATAVRLLQDGDAAYAAIEEAIGGARHHVHIEYYIFEPDETGTRLRDLLVERARAGVQVRLLVDGIGSYRLSKRFLAPLEEAGARFAWFSPVRLPQLRARNVNYRTHRKIVVVDGVIGFTGGINVTDEQSVAKSGHRAYRDTHLSFEGPAVCWLQVVFLEDWHHATGHAPTGSEYFAESAGEGRYAVHVLASGPDQDWEAIKKVYFSAITSARKRVLVTAPYFVPDETMLTALVTAALRGVDVRVLVPLRSDSRVVTAAARSYYAELVRAGVRIFEYAPRMLHAKTLIVDDDLAAVGTANMDNRSFRLNYEVTAVVFDATVAGELAAAFAADVAHARAIEPGALANLPLGRQLVEAGARLLSPLL